MSANQKDGYKLSVFISFVLLYLLNHQLLQKAKHFLLLVEVETILALKDLVSLKYCLNFYNDRIMVGRSTTRTQLKKLFTSTIENIVKEARKFYKY